MIVMLIYRLTKQHVDLYVKCIYYIHIILHNIIYTRTYWYVHAGVECTDYVYHIMVQRFEPSVRDHQ